MGYSRAGLARADALTQSDRLRHVAAFSLRRDPHRFLALVTARSTQRVARTEEAPLEMV